MVPEETFGIVDSCGITKILRLTDVLYASFIATYYFFLSNGNLKI